MIDDLEELDVRACWAHLREARVCRIARVVDGAPELRPANFAVDHASLLVRTAAGSWIAQCAREPVVVEADGLEEGPDGSTVVWSVLVEGRPRLLTDPAEFVETLGNEPFPWHGAPKPVFLRIEPTKLTGRRFTRAEPRNRGEGAGRRRPVE